jgi:hypothetical protein
MTSAIANHGKTLAPLMRRAGFRYVFLGIENILEEDLEFLRAEAKNRQRGEGAGGNAAVTAIEYLHANKMYVVGGLIVGNPSRYTRLDRGEPGVRAPLRRRAVHPAPHSLSAHADDEDVQGAGAHHQRAARGLRRHDRRGEDGAPRI